ncbi:hypothetical protein KC320_g144 [Hortaea werneckii]|nr:hypothetical protein KC320_g144 [Hortaea werneckii]
MLAHEVRVAESDKNDARVDPHNARFSSSHHHFPNVSGISRSTRISTQPEKGTSNFDDSLEALCDMPTSND